MHRYNGCIIIGSDAYYPRAPDHTYDLESMFVYKIFRTCQCLNDLRVRIYDLGALNTWLYNLEEETGLMILILSHLGIFVTTGCSSRRQYVTAVRQDIFRSMWHK